MGFDLIEIGSGSLVERFDYGLADLDRRYSLSEEDEEWTIGSTPGISSGCRSPVSLSDDMKSVWESPNKTIAAASEVDISEVYTMEIYAL